MDAVAVDFAFVVFGVEVVVVLCPAPLPADAGAVVLLDGVVFEDAPVGDRAEPDAWEGAAGVDPMGDDDTAGGAEVVVGTAPGPVPPPPELALPPPLDGATGVTPGQAWAKAAAGGTDGFGALGLLGPGF